MAGRQTLDLAIKVRILVPEQPGKEDQKKGAAGKAEKTNGPMV
jgi:hypothetical protein